MRRFSRPLSLTCLMAMLLLLGPGCAMVTVKQVTVPDYTAARRADVLSDGRLGFAAREAVGVVGLDPAQCEREVPDCIERFRQQPGVETEVRLATLAELWTKQAMGLAAADRKAGAGQSVAAVEAWLEAARHAYAYLFFSGRSPADRALEDRLTQVRDYYNNAAEQAAAMVFERAREQALAAGGADTGIRLQEERWTVSARYDQLGLQGIPRSMVATSNLGFAGMRSTYRRDGFGAELVVLMEPTQVTAPLQELEETGGLRARGPVFSEMPAINATAILRFGGNTLEEVMATRQIHLEAYAPERTQTISMEGQQVPLAGNYTAAYALWLAQSGFAGQSLRTLFGRGESLTEPHIYLMQPFDPSKRIIFLLHGLASSPEAWVNLVNEVTGDRALRERFQIWSVYYPTNAPIALNRYTVSRALNQTLAHFDPGHVTQASKDMVFIGHSMGGILARLMISQPGDTLMAPLLARRDLDPARRQQVERRLAPLLRYQPQDNVARAIFIAAPHQGTEAAGNRLGRLIGKLVRLPLTILGGFADVVELLVDPGAEGADADRAEGKPRMPTSIDNLKADDPFIRSSARLLPPPGLPYHSIIARRDPEVPLEQSDDGLVPYWSAHLPAATSEKVVTGWHSVQEKPEAVLEVRRILHEELARSGERTGTFEGGL